MKKTIPLSTLVPFKFEWRFHTSDYSPEAPRRVWRNDWPGDQFNIVGPDQFRMIEEVCDMFSISLNEVED